MMVKHDLSSFTNDMRMNAPMIGINLIIIVINIVFSIIVIIIVTTIVIIIIVCYPSPMI